MLFFTPTQPQGFMSKHFFPPRFRVKYPSFSPLGVACKNSKYAKNSLLRMVTNRFRFHLLLVQIFFLPSSASAFSFLNGGSHPCFGSVNRTLVFGIPVPNPSTAAVGYRSPDLPLHGQPGMGNVRFLSFSIDHA